MPNHDPLCPQAGAGMVIGGTACGYCELITKVAAREKYRMAETLQGDEVRQIVESHVLAALTVERRRIGIWLEKQGQRARYARRGQHTETMTNTQAAAFGWASHRVLSNALDEEEDA